MYRTLLLLIVIVVSLSTLNAQATYFSKEKLTKDVNQLKKTLLAIHPGLDYFTPRSVVEQMFEESISSLPDSMTRMDFYDLLEPIIDTIKCGHTNIQFSHKLYKEKEDRDKPQLFPLKLVMINNEVLLKEAFDIGGIEIPRGSQILSIDTVEIDKIVDQISKYHKGADGDYKYPERLWAVRGFTGGYARFFGLKDKFVVRLINSQTTEEQTYTIDAIPPNALKKINKEESKEKFPVTYKTLADSKIGLLTITSFSDKGTFNKSKGIFKKAFAEMKKADVEKLIIDVRNNGGGAIGNIKHLTRHLLDEEYLIVKQGTIEDDFKEEKKSFFQSLHFAFSGKEHLGNKYYYKRFNKKNIKPKSEKKRFSGDLVVLINSRSYSAAALTPALLKDRERATLIGEVAGGSHYLAFAGFSKYVKLDNTKLRVRVPIIKLVYDVVEDRQDVRKGVIPDIYKVYTKEDLTNETDTVLEYAIEYLQDKS